MSVEIDRNSMNNLRVFLASISKDAPKIMSRTLNETAKKTKTDGSKAIRKQVNLSAAYVSDHMKVNKASFKKLQASVSTPKRGLLLSYYLYGVTGISEKGNATRGALLKYKKGFFSVANLDQPLKVKVKPNKPPQKLGPEWFILPKLKNSNLPGLAKRVNGKLRLHGPSISQVFTDVKEDLAEPMLEYQAEQMSKQIDTVFRGY